MNCARRWKDPLRFRSNSTIFDPVNRFPVRRIVKALYMEYDILLPAGRVIARL